MAAPAGVSVAREDRREGALPASITFPPNKFDIGQEVTIMVARYDSHRDRQRGTIASGFYFPGSPTLTRSGWCYAVTYRTPGGMRFTLQRWEEDITP